MDHTAQLDMKYIDSQLLIFKHLIEGKILYMPKRRKEGREERKKENKIESM